MSKRKAFNRNAPADTEFEPTTGPTELAKLSLRTLKQRAEVHVACGDKAHRVADDHFIQAGRYLKEARDRIKNMPDLTFVDWLFMTGISKSRAYELIQVAERRIDLDGLRLAAARRARESRAQYNRIPDGLGKKAEEKAEKFATECERFLDLAHDAAVQVMEYLETGRGAPWDEHNDLIAAEAKRLEEQRAALKTPAEPAMAQKADPSPSVSGETQAATEAGRDEGPLRHGQVAGDVALSNQEVTDPPKPRSRRKLTLTQMERVRNDDLRRANSLMKKLSPDERAEVLELMQYLAEGRSKEKAA